MLGFVGIGVGHKRQFVLGFWLGVWGVGTVVHGGSLCQVLDGLNEQWTVYTRKEVQAWGCYTWVSQGFLLYIPVPNHI